MIGKLQKIKKTVNSTYRCVAMIAVVSILIIMTAQAFFRYALNNSITWSEELARFMFVWASMMGAVVVTGNHGHATIKMLDGILPQVVTDIKQIIFDLVSFAIGLILVFYGVKLVNSVWNQTSAALKLCYAYVYMAIPIGGFGIAVQSLINCIETALQMKNGQTAELKSEEKEMGGVQE